MAFDDQETCRGRDTGHYDLCVMETKCTEKLLVYDVTPFLEDHPGGDEVLLLATEKDATEDFETVGHSLSATEEMEKYYIGNIDMSTVPKVDYRPPASKSASTETKAATETTSSNQSSGSLIKVLQLLIPLLIIVVAFYLQYYGKKQ
ncbi:cytochrome B5-like isoform X1 [Cucumis melo]|uniref:Cytochrome B5-like isoform X1 n=1 Tax=Cucumis melo TaxID=3656 RepID=A0ABM3KVI4_CUCME|nr:cytochrome B5-like isoform X1 [Cucumis melo]